MIAGPVFVAVFLAEGAARDGYRPLRHPVSSLALGPRGWIQAGNFAVTGAMILSGAGGLARGGGPAARGRAVPALIGAAGAGLVAAAVFATDPVSGYPPGTPDALPEPSRPRRPQPGGHPGLLRPARRRAGLRLAVLAEGPARIRGIQRGHRHYHAGHDGSVLGGLGQSPRLVSLGGLFQRASIITGFAWLSATFARALRAARSPET